MIKRARTISDVESKFLHDLYLHKRGELDGLLSIDFSWLDDQEKRRYEYLPEWVEELVNERLDGTLPGDLFVNHWSGLVGLYGAPKYIQGDLDCSKTSCGTPSTGGNGLGAEDIEYVGGSLICSDMIHMHTLQGLPKRIVGSIDCNGSKQLERFGKDVPNKVEDFLCFNCPLLESLENCPKEVNYFDCTDCPKLKFDPKHHPWNAKEFECDEKYRSELQLYLAFQSVEQGMDEEDAAMIKNAFEEFE